MGKINVKIANNYDVDPIAAAASYAGKNYIDNYNFPPVKQWLPNYSINLLEGFAMYAILADNSGVVGLTVCHLRNQQQGVDDLLLKTMDTLLADGKITADERANFDLAISINGGSAALLNQLFIDAAIYTADRMNKIGNSNIDFNYQFNPSAVQGLEPSFTNLVSGLGFKNAQLGATMSSGAAGFADINVESPIGSGDDYILPGWYGVLRTYVKGNVQSFYDAQRDFVPLEPGQDPQEAIDEIIDAQKDNLTACKEEQEAAYEKQQKAIDDRTTGGGPS